MISSNPLDSIFNPDRLLKAIATYRLSNFNNIHIEELENVFDFINLFNLICLNIGGCPVFRVRQNDGGNPYCKSSDLWIPPSCLTKLGRANRKGHPVFYGSFDPITAIKEARIKQGSYFSIANFNLSSMNVNDLSSIIITLPKNHHLGSETQRLYSMILNDFIFAEFTKPVGVGTEFNYKASCLLAEKYFSTPNKDSIVYPSVYDYGSFNIAFQEEAATKRLMLNQVLFSRLEGWSTDGFPIISTFQEGKLADKENLSYKDFHPDARNFELKPDKLWKGGDSINKRLITMLQKLAYTPNV